MPLELLRIDDRSAGLAHGRVDAAVLRGRSRCPACSAERLFAEPRLAAVPADSPLADAAHAHASPTWPGTRWRSTRCPVPRPSAVAGQRPAATRSTVANTDDWLAAIAAGRAVGVTTSATAEHAPAPGGALPPAVRRARRRRVPGLAAAAQPSRGDRPARAAARGGGRRSGYGPEVTSRSQPAGEVGLIDRSNSSRAGPVDSGDARGSVTPPSDQRAGSTAMSGEGRPAMRVAVLGAGNGGLAAAFDFAQHGHEVRLFSLPDYADNTVAVTAAGGITASGDLEGFAPIAYSGTDAAATLTDAELVLVVGPAYAIEPLATAARPALAPGTAVIVCPSATAGAIAFKHAIGLELADDSITVGETSTLPYAVRATAPAHVHVYLKLTTGMFLAGLPRSGTDRLYELVREVYPATVRAESVLQTSLQNGNPVIHPAVTVLNAALIERTNGGFLFYEDGVTPAVGRLIEAVDRERIALAEALGVTILSEPELGMRQGYMTETNYSTGYSQAPGFRGIAAQSRLDNRYLTEDVGYSLVFLADLARAVGVPTPSMDALIQIAGVLLGRDFLTERNRTLASLGLDRLNPDELAAL